MTANTRRPLLRHMLGAALLCAAAASGAAPDSPPADARYRDASAPVETRVEDLLKRMTLAEKIGQMTQGERGSVAPEAAARGLLGSVLSGGGSAPRPNRLESWAAMIDGYQTAAAATRLGIPVLYGIDAVHGHQSVAGATLFPHLLGLAATRDEGLLRRVGEVTAREMAATGIYWNFSPMVAVTQDLRWGRTYESFGEDPAVVSALGRAYVQGLMQPLGAGAPRVLPTAKHFIGDGATAWASARQNIMNTEYLLDQGDTRGDTAALLAQHLPPYRALVEAGVMSVMASFSSWNGTKMHGQRELLTGVLKERLGFQGFVISDWDAIQQLPGSLRQQVVAAVNAGVDMAMVPTTSREFMQALTEAVNQGEVQPARIDDAVRRILRAKFQMGLFEQSRALASLGTAFGSAAHRAVAREAVARSATLLKNDAGTLPIAAGTRVFVAGEWADDLGVQSGGWTLEWQGVRGNQGITGTTLLEGFRQLGGAEQVTYDRRGRHSGRADVGVVVVGEPPYAEGVGDRQTARLALSPDDLATVRAVRERVGKLVLVVLAGRPLLLGEALAQADAVVMAYLPGSEGAGVADVLWGAQPFRGRLPIGWPKDAASYTRADAPAVVRCASLQWSLGYGLDAQGKALGPVACAP
ncbi:MAG TPA: glycoside hydrolase family 3 protein [Burkholderiaceae bacterium]|nr:glycoside hydrolase family 3 protein [Burkholderiaceae bacterium]